MLAMLAAALAAPHSSIEVPVRTGATAPEDHAVVIGIEDYFALPDVPYAEADAGAWSDFFVYTRGVPSAQVTRVVGQPSRERILAALEAAGHSTGTVFVVFAGHGAAHFATGTPMIMPAETPTDPVGFAARGISLDRVHELAGAGGARVVVITDACYTGVDRGGDPLVPGARFAVPAWTDAPAAEGVTWRATAANQVALPLHDVEHGAFSYVALQALRGGADGERDGQQDGRVTGEEATLFTQRRLRELGLMSQSPSWKGPHDFVFVDAPGKLVQPAESPNEPEPEATVRAPTVNPLVFLTPAPRDRSAKVVTAPPPAVEAVRATSPRAHAVRPPKPPSELRRALEVEAALGTWAGVRVVHRWDGLLRRVGLESGVAVGSMGYFQCGAATCSEAHTSGAPMKFTHAYVPFAHPLALHVALSPAARGPLSRLDLAGSVGVGLSVHPEINGVYVGPGYTVQGRWTPGKGGWWLALGLSGNDGNWGAWGEFPNSWGPTLTVLAGVGVKLGTVWRAEP